MKSLQEWTRRDFLQHAARATAAGMALLSPGRALARLDAPRAGVASELDATAPDGIDLVLEHRLLRVDGQIGQAIAINGSIPGPVIRMQEGGDALIRVHNRMSTESTSVHWHGLILPFTMDGVPGISYGGIPAGETFTYRFPVRQNGTYWYHSHTGLQEQLGHYGQLILEPAGRDPVDYDVEHSIVLSDWTFDNPHTVARNLKTIEGYYNFQRPTVVNLDNQMRAQNATLGEVFANRLRWQWMRMDPTDIADITSATYTYLMNGHAPDENWTAIAQPGQRVRLRVVNASTMTYYDFRIDGLAMTVVQADGQNIEPVEVDELRIAVAETYDVIVELPDDRAYTIFAETMDRSGYARGTIGSRAGMAGEIPKRRRRPMRGMADMGMVMQGGGMAGGGMAGMAEMGDMGGRKMDDGSMDDGDGMSAMEMPRQNASGAPGESTAPEANSMKAAGPRGPDSMMGHSRSLLPTEGLPDRIAHGPDTHGPGSVVMAKSAYRRLDDPGVGLGDDGRRVLTYGQLRCLTTPPDRRPPRREFDLHLTGNMAKYIWGFDGKKWSESEMIRFQYGERLRINMINDTMMSHPIHLHGMWMDLYTGGDYANGPRKHTVNVQPAELLTVDISADAPGQWAFHCHLLYHMEMGMFRTVAVVRSLEGGPIDVGV